jgi:glutathione peroxidase
MTLRQDCRPLSRRRAATRLVGAALAALTIAASTAAAAACPKVLTHTQPRLQDERPIDLCGYAGQVVLVVNTASFCGYTKQYQGLEELNRRYGGRGLVVLGFPSNDFGRQEPGSNAQIAEFCESTFGVRFPMFAKSAVVGPTANPVFKGLAERTGEVPGWNFHKYLISRDGNEVLSFASAVDPQSRQFTREIERLLSKK